MKLRDTVPQKRALNNAFGSTPEDTFGGATFVANYFDNPSLILETGQVPASASRGTIATVVDFEGYIREVPSAEIRFGGMRRVQNLITANTGLNGGIPATGWSRLSAGGTETASTSTQFGGHSVITFTCNNNREILGITLNVVAGRKYVASVYCVTKSGTFTDSSLMCVPGTGTLSGVTNVTSNNFVAGSRVATVPFDCTVSGTITFRLGIGCGAIDTGNGSISLVAPMLEDVTGQAYTAPSEYLSVGVLASPWQGANVDGVKYFRTRNGNVVNQNQLIRSQDFSAGGWALDNGGTGSLPVLTTGFTDPLGGNTACRLQLNKGTGVGYSRIRQIALTSATVPAYTIGIWMRSNTGSSYIVRLRDGANADGGSNKVVDGTWRFFWTTNASFSAGHLLEVLLWDSGTATSETADIVIAFAQMNPGYNPGTYVATTSVVISLNTVTDEVGPVITSTNDMGLWKELGATDLLLARADARDMTTANWALGATMTRARTQIGWDGIANTATLLTGGAVAATNRITMTFALAAASRTYSVGLKRGTGTGAIRISQDNFATSTDVSSLLNTSTFTRVALVQSQLNPVIGIQIDTNGDTVIADWNQYESGDVAVNINSRIPTSVSSRNTDVVYYATTGWFNPVASTLYAEWYQPSGAPAATKGGFSLHDGTANERMMVYTNNPSDALTITTDGGVVQATLSAAGLATNVVRKVIGIFKANDFAGFANNATMGTDVAGTLPTVTQAHPGGDAGTSGLLEQPLRKAIYYPYRMAAVYAQPKTV